LNFQKTCFSPFSEIVFIAGRQVLITFLPKHLVRLGAYQNSIILFEHAD